MVLVTYDEYLTTTSWMCRAMQAKDRANWHCQTPGCLSEGPLEVHHLTYARVGRERPDDLVVLCEDCHAAAHARRAARVSPQLGLPFGEAAVVH